MTFEELRDKAHSLPLKPGVYIMQNAQSEVIYVGKAKALKNRVSQYFQDQSRHNEKTRAMVSQIDHFDVIIADSGSHVVFGNTPTRPEDDIATYTFEYWARSDTHERADLTSVTEDLTLYPVFKPTYKKFLISFNINGGNTSLAFVSSFWPCHGPEDQPVYPGIPPGIHG